MQHDRRNTTRGGQLSVEASPVAGLPLQLRSSASLPGLDGRGSGRPGSPFPILPGRPEPRLPGVARQRRRPSPGLPAGQRRGPGRILGRFCQSRSRDGGLPWAGRTRLRQILPGYLHLLPCPPDDPGRSSSFPNRPDASLLPRKARPAAALPQALQLRGSRRPAGETAA